jgi:hypothetical protein
MPGRGSAALKLQALDVRSYREENDLHSLPNEIRDAVQAALRLQSFYQRWRHEHFVVRDPWEILRQMQGHRVFVVELETPQGRDQSAIVAASILWDYDLPVLVGTAPQAMRFLEVGTQRCILNGFNIQQILNSVSLMTSLIHDPHGMYLGAVYAANDRTIDNIIRNMDYVPWDAVPAALTCMLDHRAGTARTGKRIRFFRANIGSVFAAATCIADLAANPIRPRKHKPSAEQVQAALPDFDELEFYCDAALIEPLVHYSERIIEQRPADLIALRTALENPTVSEDFLMWNDQPIGAQIENNPGILLALWRRILRLPGG